MFVNDRNRKVRKRMGTGTRYESSWRKLDGWFVLSLVCLVILVLPAVVFGSMLDRYPDVHVDEPFFNLPAAHWVRGEGFYVVAFSEMPYETETFAKHAPLFAQTQKLTFWWFGIRHFSARVTSLLCGTLAALILSGFLIERGYRFAPCFVALTFVADPVWMLLLDGRPEGMALLALSGSFLAWNRMIEHPVFWRAFLWGLTGGTAIAVHPGTLFFVAVGFMVALGILNPARWLHVALGTTIGGAATLGYWLAAWWPLWLGSLTQFLEYVNVQKNMISETNFRHILNYLRISRWYFFQVSAVMIFSGGLIGLGLLRNFWRLRRRWSSGQRDSTGQERLKALGQDEILFAGAAAYSTAGGLMFLAAAKFPYYMSYFMMWPPLLVAIGAERGGSLGWTRFGWVCRVLALSLLLTALPSVAWNVTRAREAWRDYAALDPAIALTRIQQAIPSEANVWISPTLYQLREHLDNPIQLIPIYPRNEVPPPDVWLIFDQTHFEQQKNNRSLLANRVRLTHPRVFMVPLYQGARGGPRSIFVFPPKNANPQRITRVAGVSELQLWVEMPIHLDDLPPFGDSSRN